MTLVSGIATYAIVWWLTLFVVLPFGIVTQEEVGEVEEGSAPSAPVRPQIIRKVLITTAVSAVIFGAVYWFLEHSGVGLDDLPFAPTFEEKY
jgi:predicted secreted protein